MPLRRVKTHRKPLHTPLGGERRRCAPRLPGRFTHKQLHRAPTSHLQKCAFSLEIQTHNLTPPPLATPKPAAVPGGPRTDRLTTSRPRQGGEGDGGVPSPILRPLPPAPNPGPARPRGCRTKVEAHRQEAGTRSARSQPNRSRTAEEPGPRGQPEPAPHSQAFAGRLGLGPRPPQGAQRSPAAGRSPARLALRAPVDPSTEKPQASGAPRSHPKSPRRAGGRPGASGRPGLASNLPGTASAAAAAGGRAAAAAVQGRLGPGGALRGRRDRLRSGSCSARTGAGVAALRRRCSLARPPDRRSPARPPPGRSLPVAAAARCLMSTDSEKELGVRG